MITPEAAVVCVFLIVIGAVAIVGIRNL